MIARVTIGLCVKDSERSIEQSIEGIINQKYPTELIQLIVVDGCSTDKTLSIINSETSKTSMMVEIYTDEGKGLGTARQIVVDNAKGKYLIFVDADVRIFSDFVGNHVKFMEENPVIGVAFGTPIHHDRLSLVATIWDLYTSLGGSIGNDATIYRTQVLREVGGFDTKIKGAAEDKDLMIRFRLHEWQVSVNGTARYLHDHREDLRSFWREQSWFGYGDHYYFHKHSNAGVVWGKIPIGQFVWGLKVSSKAFKRTHRKISFLIPFQFIFGNLSWWFGFFKAHSDGYGHVKIG